MLRSLVHLKSLTHVTVCFKIMGDTLGGDVRKVGGCESMETDRAPSWVVVFKETKYEAGLESEI